MAKVLKDPNSQLPDFQDPKLAFKNFTSKDVEAINEHLSKTRSDRVRAVLFPETLEDPSSVPPGPQLDPRVPTALQILSQPSLELRDAIEDIINYQLDADFAAKFIPEIIKLLSDKDKDVVRNACELTGDLTKSEAACTVATKSPQLVTALLKAINAASADSKNDLLIKAGACGALLNLSKYDHGRLTLFKTGGIPVLVKLLGAPAERVVNYAISTLHNLLSFQEGTKVAVRLAGGIQKMVPLLKGKDPKFLIVNMDCLQMMAFSDVESKLAIWNSKGPKELVTIFKNRNADEKLLSTTIRLLKVLSTCPHNKEQIVESGGIEAIVARLDEKDPKIRVNYLTTLRNLSDAEANFRWDDHLITYLLSFLKYNDEEVVVLMSGVLANLSAEKPRIKQAIYRVGGIELLLQTLMTHKSEEVREPILCCLRHLTSQHQLTAEVQTEFRQLGGLELSLQVLQLATIWPIIKAACGLVRNLANCEENHQVLVDLKIIPRMGQVLALAVKEEKSVQTLVRANSIASPVGPSTPIRHSVSPSSPLRSDPPAIIDGVDMSDVIESSLATLTLLAAASMINRDDILDLQIAPLLLRLNEDNDSPENVMVACRALLEELNLLEKPRKSIISFDKTKSSMISLDKRSQMSVQEPNDRNSLELSRPASVQEDRHYSYESREVSRQVSEQEDYRHSLEMHDAPRPPVTAAREDRRNVVERHGNSQFSHEERGNIYRGMKLSMKT